MDHSNIVEFKVWGRYALFTDPITKIGGEKCSYQIPTYEALKGILSSVYWKPTFIWVIDKVRVMKRIKTQTKSIKPLNYGGIYPSKKTLGRKEEPFNDLAIYTYLSDVEYQVQAHFEWNMNRDDLVNDRNEHKHYCIANRMIERGGRRDVFLGTRECQGYVEPCKFGDDSGDYDNYGELSFGLMFHSFEYPDESSEKDKFYAHLWYPKMINGIVEFPPPKDKSLIRRFVRSMIMNPPPSIGLNEQSLKDECEMNVKRRK